MDKQDIQHWNGEGLPPVGTECEMEHNQEHWLPVVIIATADGFTFGWNYDHRITIHSDKPIDFRPILTPEQIEAERRERVCDCFDDIFYNRALTRKDGFYAIYDAIRAGKIEGVKIDG